MSAIADRRNLSLASAENQAACGLRITFSNCNSSAATDGSVSSTSKPAPLSCPARSPRIRESVLTSSPLLTGRTGIAEQGKNAETTMTVLNQMLGCRIAARARVHANRADTRARVEVDHGKRQAAETHRFDKCSTRPKMNPSTRAVLMPLLPVLPGTMTRFAPISSHASPTPRRNRSKTGFRNESTTPQSLGGMTPMPLNLPARRSRPLGSGPRYPRLRAAASTF